MPASGARRACAAVLIIMKGIIAIILIPITEVVCEITCLAESYQFTDTTATHSLLSYLFVRPRAFLITQLFASTVV
jgi:hypothetical protein